MTSVRAAFVPAARGTRHAVGDRLDSPSAPCSRWQTLSAARNVVTRPLLNAGRGSAGTTGSTPPIIARTAPVTITRA